MKKINISLSFRTYEGRGLLAHHKFLTNGYVKVISLEFLKKNYIQVLNIIH